MTKKKLLFYLFYRENERVLALAVIALAKFTELIIELFNHPPYFPDLAIIDDFLFTSSNKWFRGKSINDKLIAQTKASTKLVI